jgi:branched-chain amino acid aminotransferase
VLRGWGVPAEERLLSVDELIGAAESGKLEEAFGTGTAAVISPIGELMYQGKKYTVNDFKIGPTAQKLYDELTGIQWGTRPDTYGWTECV